MALPKAKNDREVCSEQGTALVKQILKRGAGETNQSENIKTEDKKREESRCHWQIAIGRNKLLYWKKYIHKIFSTLQ